MPSHHITLIDDYAAHGKELKKLSALWHDWKNTEDRLISERARIEKTRADEEFFRSALEDLDALDPQDGEEDKLTQLRDRLMRREKDY